jgi:hypothetical protein
MLGEGGRISSSDSTFAEAAVDGKSQVLPPLAVNPARCMVILLSV